MLDNKSKLYKLAINVEVGFYVFWLLPISLKKSAEGDSVIFAFSENQQQKFIVNLNIKVPYFYPKSIIFNR